MNVTFRNFIKEDRNTFFAMVKKFYAPPAVLHFPSDEVMLSAFDAAIDMPNYVKGYIFECEGKPAGYAMVSLKFETEVGGLAAWIEELFVEEEFRSAGIGSKFFEFLQNELAGRIRRIRLEVGEDNLDAIRLYKRLGFEFLDYRQMTIDKDF